MMIKWGYWQVSCQECESILWGSRRGGLVCCEGGCCDGMQIGTCSSEYCLF